ncbi:hypothetical protein [Arthrobacter sp. A2-55]|uniref:hypothetical protein n=1 Tax=Arthrobacter sp. A2-55 TaxID=2897337 RepID=UPI0021CD4403|nr:hypothetical protein [Arthrobacter sp. A2-55]MCU6480146.1 hypothetical protein [Arthrobacter sp. A2-55]
MVIHEFWRRAGLRDRGFVLITTLLVLVLLSGTVYAMLASTARTTQSATTARDFGQSGKLADVAIQDAVYQLNENGKKPGASFTSPYQDKSGGWEWSIGAATGIGARTATITAAGTFRGTTRKVSAEVGSLVVGGYTAGTNEVVYELSPETAFSHVAIGENITMQNGAGVGAATKFVTGRVGVLKNAPVMTPAAGTSSIDDGRYMLYGKDASQALQNNAVQVPVGLRLDARFVTDNADRCVGVSPVPWVASENGGRLVANDNTGCYSTMNFDVPTIIQGSGAFNAFATGQVTISANITAPPSTGLNIYASGNVSFDVDKATTSSLTVNNTFIYAPNGTCKTLVTGQPAEFRSTTKSLDFTGSLACNTILVAGKFAPATPINPLGSKRNAAGTLLPGLYNSEIWYLADYTQPAGIRGPAS